MENNDDVYEKLEKGIQSDEESSNEHDSCNSEEAVNTEESPNTEDTNDEKKSIDDVENIRKIIFDFTNDLLVTFPELKTKLNTNLQSILKNENVNDAIDNIKEHCIGIYPEKFFDILYQNEKIFDGDETLYLLPDIDFKLLWKENISETTRKTIWKYLQLLLFSLVTEIPNSSSFGDTAKLFEAIDTDEFKSKLEETISNMESSFDTSGNVFSDMSFNNTEDLPDPEKLHEHLNKMLDGKLGNLAREIAEETAADINMDMNDETSVNDVFQSLFKNPTKLMDLVTKVGGKLDDKIKSGDIKESELLSEAAEMMQNMKNMPGMENIQNMFKQGGMGGMGSDKMNLNAMQAQMQRNIKLAKQKERMKKKAEQKSESRDTNTVSDEMFDNANKAAMELLISEGVKFEDLENVIFSTGEKYEKTPRNPNPEIDTKKKKKKKKRKQNK